MQQPKSNDATRAALMALLNMMETQFCHEFQLSMSYPFKHIKSGCHLVIKVSDTHHYMINGDAKVSSVFRADTTKTPAEIKEIDPGTNYDQIIERILTDHRGDMDTNKTLVYIYPLVLVPDAARREGGYSWQPMFGAMEYKGGHKLFITAEMMAELAAGPIYRQSALIRHKIESVETYAGATDHVKLRYSQTMKEALNEALNIGNKGSPLTQLIEKTKRYASEYNRALAARGRLHHLAWK